MISVKHSRTGKSAERGAQGTAQIFAEPPVPTAGSHLSTPSLTPHSCIVISRLFCTGTPSLLFVLLPPHHHSPSTLPWLFHLCQPASLSSSP